MKLSLSRLFITLLVFLLPILLLANTIAPNINGNKNNISSFVSSLTPEEQKSLAKIQSLNYVYDPDWAPFEWKNDIGQHTGIIADILHLLEHKTDITFTDINTNTWEESVNLVKDEKVDMFSAITINSDREKYLHFTSKDIFSYPAVLVTRFNDKRVYIDIKKDIKDKKIGIVKSSGLGSYIKENNPDLNFIEIASTQEGFSLLSSNDVDLFAINAVTARYFIEKKGFSNLKIALKLDYAYHLKIAINNKLPYEIISILDKALNNVSEEEINNIFSKWTEVTISKQTDWTLVVQIFSVIFFVLLFFLWNTRRLNLLVKNRTKELEIANLKQKKYLDIVDNHVISSSTDTNGMITDASKAFCKISKYSPEELIGASHNIVRHPDMPKSLYEKMWNDLQNGKAWGGTIKNKAKDGTQYWVEAHIEPVYDESGKIKGYTAIRKDITDKKHIEEISVTDPLTGLFNRLKIDQKLIEEYHLSKRYLHPLSIIMFDIDHFKEINDSYGHQMGDTVLKEIAKLFRKSIRRTDFFGRWGGDEFIIICPETPTIGTLDLAETLRYKIEQKEFQQIKKVTCSFGVSTLLNEDTIETLISRADKALYQVKEMGRNQVISADARNQES